MKETTIFRLFLGIVFCGLLMYTSYNIGYNNGKRAYVKETVENAIDSIKIKRDSIRVADTNSIGLY